MPLGHAERHGAERQPGRDETAGEEGDDNDNGKPCSAQWNWSRQRGRGISALYRGNRAIFRRFCAHLSQPHTAFGSQQGR
ncbi:hypothetical protein GCM10027612_72290 [Microbispora bryophytorum subsp. camponoti]